MSITSDLSVFEKYRESVNSGLAFHRISGSNRSADQMNYAPMLTAEEFGKVVVSLGNAARMGDVFMYATREALQAVSPYMTGWQIAAAIADAFAEFQKKGWHDTRSATGPEAGRPSSHQEEVDERTTVMLHLILAEATWNLRLGSVPGIGWAMRDLLKELGIQVYDTYLPNVAKNLRD